MLEQVLSVLAPRALERWLALALQPMVLLLCCAAVVSWSDGDLDRARAVGEWLEKAGTPVTGVLVVAVALALAGAGLLGLALAAPVLRFLHGLGPVWRWCGRPFLWWARRRTRRIRARWVLGLARQGAAGAGPRELADYQRWERARRRYPADPAYLLPTRLGNLVRASERRIEGRYGLDPAAVWPALTRALPEQALLAAERARGGLDRATAAMVWGVVFAVTMWPFSMWALPVGLLAVPVVVRGVLPGRAARFATELEAVFAAHRGELYRVSRWPLPPSPAGEPAAGRALTVHITRGSDDPSARFTP
ncbi:hypothetical protein [Streptomyces sp. NPDC094468]|uniref:hypothetical protein n=1 Tax=Streptomyces sp. NPDC094468 TaxID=3366066 RepID=UPI00380AB220